MSDLTLAHIALGLDAPPMPPRQPPDAARAVESCQQYVTRCQELMQHAHTSEQRQFAQFWIDNAERQLARWQAALDRQR